MVTVKAPDGRVITYDNMTEAKTKMIAASKKYKWSLSDFELSDDDGDSWRNADIYDFSGKERPSEKKQEATKASWYESLAPSARKAAEDYVSDPNFGVTGLLQAAVEDGLSTPGRTLSALADAFFNRRDEQSKKDAFLTSMALKQGEKSDDLEERWGIEDIVQNILRDPMTIPSTVLGGALSKIPGLSTLGKGVTAPVKRFALTDLVKPAAIGAIQGLASEAARPAITTSEFDPEKLAEGAVYGAGMGTVFHNLGGAAKLAASKAKDTKQIKSILDRFTNNNDYADLPEEGILADIERKYGIKLDDFTPDMVRSKPKESFWDADDPNFNQAVAALENNNRMTPGTLLEATSPKQLLEIKKEYRNIPEIAKKIIEVLEPENLTAKDAAIWGKHIEDATKSGRKINTKALVEILNEESERVAKRGNRRYPGENTMLGRLKGWLGPLTSKKGAPAEVSPWVLNDFRNKIGKSVNWDVLEANGFSQQEINAMKRAYGKSREMLLADAIANEGNEAAAAYNRMGEDYALRDAVFRVLNAGNVKDAQRSRIATILKNKGNLNESNAPKTEELFEVLQKLDKRLKTNITDRARDAYHANQLSPEGEVFRLPDYNPNVTGKSYSVDPVEAAMQGSTIKSAFTEVARGKAKALNNARAANRAINPTKTMSAVKEFLSKNIKSPAVYERPDPVAQLNMAQRRDYQRMKDLFGEESANYWASTLGGIDYSEAGDR